MRQNWQRQNWKDFLLEHYTQVNQHLRESDRNRNTLFGFYITLTVGMLGFAYSSFAHTTEYLHLKLIILVFLILFGIGVAVYTTFARAWHCEYTRVAIAIHKSFLNANLKLYKAAKEIRKREEDRPTPRHYFNMLGTESIMMVLLLLFISFESILLIHELGPDGLSSWPICLSIICFILVFGVGIYLYRHYLDKRENEFPHDCWCIFKEKEDSMDEIEGKVRDTIRQFETSQGKALCLYIPGIMFVVAGVMLVTAISNSCLGLIVFTIGLLLLISSPFLLKRFVRDKQD